MKRSILSVLLLAFNILLFGQTKEQKVYNVSQIQGIWQLYFNYTYPNPGDAASYTTFYIFKGKKCLDVDITGSPLDKLSVVVSDYGFANSYFRDSICAMKHLNDTGMVYVEIDENADLKDCHVNIASIFELRPKGYLNIFSDECNYIEKAPKEVLEVLYKRGKHDKRDYIKEFLDVQVCGIQTEKSFIYDSTQHKTKMYLVKDDIITVTGEQNGFVKMEYETAKGDTIKGWLKKEDTK
jgi:hypothetical protein